MLGKVVHSLLFKSNFLPLLVTIFLLLKEPSPPSASHKSGCEAVVAKAVNFVEFCQPVLSVCLMDYVVHQLNCFSTI